MSPMEWQRVCATASANVSLKDLDDQLERIPYLTEDERSAIWLYAWASRENVARVAALAA
ncbi:MAG TPA: hypothetical protein VE992_02710 [Solirubrobacteraceae bacterium]|nr:hypothetical protein [Solirubrobacteraceae bacterium]